MKWLDYFFPRAIDVEYLSMDYCEGKTNKELLNKLKSNTISLHSGHMIVTELLERLIKD